MAAHNPMLTIEQEKQMSSLLGSKVRLRLLYRGSVHGYHANAFHQRCDRKGPTLTVAYNASGYVFGGYTSAGYAQTGHYVSDDKAFLFSLHGPNLARYMVRQQAAGYARYDGIGLGPHFGAHDLVCLYHNRAQAFTKPGACYNFSAADMHGNDLQLTECEVYQVKEGFVTLEKPWRNVLWTSGRRKELMATIKSYRPTISSVGQARVALIGPIGAGKSSFFNSVNSVFRGHVTGQAISGCAGTSLTTQFRTYSVRAGREGKPLPIILCDTMGLEEATGSGLDLDDISSILKGRVPDRYKFNPTLPLQSDDHGFRKCVRLQDRIHCVAYVVDICKVSMPTKLEDKMSAIRKKVNLMGIPQLVLLTKVDEACPCVAEDLQNIYHSHYVKAKTQEVSSCLGMPVSCVVPVKNYSQELELELNSDILLLSAVLQMLRFSDNYFDDVRSMEGKECIKLE